MKLKVFAASFGNNLCQIWLTPGSFNIDVKDSGVGYFGKSFWVGVVLFV